MSNAISYDLQTLAFYENHSQDYYQSTVGLGMRELYGPFLSELPPAGRILDAGCGSGRDAKAFLERGYRVVAVDASPKMAQLATALIGQSCKVLCFQEMEFHEEFDGIWACASLLHVPKSQMHDVMRRFIKALKPGGIFYLSLKEGEGEHVAEDGRFFNYYTVESFRRLLANFPVLRELAFWKTEEIRSHEHRSLWLNFLLKKQSE
ncbi:MAG TPA: class I SAM-dependent methyltransferase [Candidatus Binatia bacterium]|nr:class I SAM-dependent methyltransferase [Candidatus Binatia bacterium]